MTGVVEPLLRTFVLQIQYVNLVLFNSIIRRIFYIFKQLRLFVSAVPRHPHNPHENIMLLAVFYNLGQRGDILREFFKRLIEILRFIFFELVTHGAFVHSAVINAFRLRQIFIRHRIFAVNKLIKAVCDKRIKSVTLKIRIRLIWFFVPYVGWVCIKFIIQRKIVKPDYKLRADIYFIFLYHIAQIRYNAVIQSEIDIPRIAPVLHKCGNHNGVAEKHPVPDFFGVIALRYFKIIFHKIVTVGNKPAVR